MIYCSEWGGEIEEEATHDLYVRPDGWSMEAGATAVNGLTDDFLKAHGLPIAEVLDRWEHAIEAGYMPVAFNVQFDLKIMRGELRRAGRPDHFEETPNICLMRACLGVCRVPRARGGGYKFPKLEEACAHFKIPYTRHHQAPADAEAALAIFKWLRRINCCPEPAVHYSKNHAAIEARGLSTGLSTADALRASAREADREREIMGRVVDDVVDENIYPRPTYRVVE